MDGVRTAVAAAVATLVVVGVSGAVVKGALISEPTMLMLTGTGLWVTGRGLRNRFDS